MASPSSSTQGGSVGSSVIPDMRHRLSALRKGTSHPGYLCPTRCIPQAQISQKAAAIAPPGGLVPAEVSNSEWTIKEASNEDLWHVSELHCRSFHPGDSWLLGVLQRFDRLSSFQAVGTQVKAGWGQFACLVAVSSQPRSMTNFPPRSAPEFLRAFVPQAYKEGFERPAEEAGIIGTVCVDSTGQFVPMKHRNGQLYRTEGIAYLSNLAVDHNFRRRGIGRELLDQAAQVAKGWGCRSITLQCDPRNKGAREMYIQGGYRHVSNEPVFAQYWEGRIGVRLELMCKLLCRRK